MSSNVNVYQEDWEALIGALEEAIQALSGKKVEPVKLKILEFSSTAAMLELQDLADVGNRFEAFLLFPVAPDWNEEATATLSFAMGALVEKMQMFPYSPEFSAGLGEVLMYLDFYGEGEEIPEALAEAAPPPTTPAPEPPAQTAPPPVAPAPEPRAEAAPLPTAPVPVLEEAQPDQDAGAEVHVEQILPPIDQQPDVDEDALLAEILQGVPVTEEAPEASEVPPPPVVVAVPESAPVPLARPAFEIDADADGYVIDRLEWYREVFREDSQSRLFTVLAEELSDRELWSQVIDVCRQGLVYHPESVRGRVLLGWALWETGRAAEARQVLTEAHRDVAANADLYILLARVAELDHESSLVKGFQQTGQFLEEERRRLAFEPVARAPVAMEATPALGIVPTARADEPSLAVGKPLPTEASQDSRAPEWLFLLQDAFAQREPVEPVIAHLFSDENRTMLKAVLSASLS